MKQINFKSIVVSAILTALTFLPINLFADNKVGTPDGTFSVSPLGGAVYSVTIDCPHGVNGVVPKLSLNYNSQSGYGQAGYGMSLSGLSSISRGQRDLFHDSYTKGTLYNNSDPLYLDGKRLIWDSLYYYNGTVFTIEGDPYTEVVVHGTYDDSTADMWLEVHDRSGLTIRYGETPNSRLCYTDRSGKPRIHSWYISSMEDANTNYITYTYDKTNNYVRPTNIAYGGNKTAGTGHSCSVTFEYEALGCSAQPFVFDGQKGEINVRLKKIISKIGSNVYRSYDLAYSTSLDGTDSKFARLTSITEKNGAGESLNPISFDWNGLPCINLTRTEFGFNVEDSPNVQRQGINLVSTDMNGDGVDEIIRVSPVVIHTGAGSSVYRTYIYVSRSIVDNTGSIGYSYPLVYEIESGFDINMMKHLMGGAMPIDFDGDGLNDLLFPSYDSNHGVNNLFFRIIYGRDVVVGNPQTYSFHKELVASSSTPLFASLDVNGDNLTDFLFVEKNQHNGGYPLKIICPKNISDSLSDISFSVTLPKEPKKLFSGDFNGDGLSDIVIFHKNGYKIYYNRGGAVGDPKFYEWATATGTNVKDAWRMEQGDFNGDGLTDFIVNEKSGWGLNYALSNGDGTFDYYQAVSMAYDDKNTDRDDDKFSIIVSDIDHDGKSDAVVVKADYEYHGGLFADYYEFIGTYVG